MKFIKYYGCLPGSYPADELFLRTAHGHDPMSKWAVTLLMTPPVLVLHSTFLVLSRVTIPIEPQSAGTGGVVLPAIQGVYGVSLGENVKRSPRNLLSQCNPESGV